MIQFSNNDRLSTLTSRKTSGRRSYFTLAKGGYIIRIRPIAIRTLVVPTWKLLMNFSTPGMK